MTFDDGILKIYKTVNVAEPGEKPTYKLELKSEHFYKNDVLGVTRYYTALQANQKIDAVVNIPEWFDITTDDICILEDNEQYKIQMMQFDKDDNNLNILKLSLERLAEKYD